MNKKIMLGIGAVIVLALAAFAYTRRPSSSVPTAPANQTNNEAVSEAQEFAQAVESGRPTICLMARGTESMEYKIKGKKMRGNIKTDSSVSHLISDESYFYMWVDGQNQGTKMSLAIPSPSVNTNTPNAAPNFEDEADYESLKNEGYTINCAAGTVNDSEFVPPTNVTFSDLSAMMQAIPSPGSNGQIDYQKLQEQYGAQE